MTEPLLPHPDPLPRARGRGSSILFRYSLVVCLLVALATRWLFLAAESLWLDEGWTWWVTSLPPGQMLRAIRADVVAPAYFAAMAAWTHLFGDGVLAMRSLSALFATLALVPFVHLARRALASRTAITVACALFAVSFMQSQHARDARPYALLCLVTIGALACVPTLAARRSWAAIIGFAACVAIGCYAHNVMPFYAVCLAAAWLVWPGGRPARGRLIDLAIATSFLVVAYAPWLPSLREQARWMTGTFWASRPDAWAAGVTLSAVAGVDVYAVPPMVWNVTGESVPAGLVAIVTCTSVAIAVISGAFANGRHSTGVPPVLPPCADRHTTTALAIAAFGPMVLVFVYSTLGQPIFIERVFLASSAVVPLIVALPLAHGRRSVRLVGGVAAALLLALGTVSTASLLTSPQKEDWRGAHDWVAALPESERRLIVFVASEGELPFAYYASRDADRRVEPRTGVPGGFFDLDPPRTIRRVRGDADLAGLRATLAGGRLDEVVLVLGHDAFADPQALTEARLRDEWRAIDETTLRHVRVVRFTIPVPSPP